MLLRITIIFFGGNGKDTVRYHGLTSEQASTHKEQFLKEIQTCIEKDKIFYVSGDGGQTAGMLAYGPDLLRSACLRFDIVDE